MQENLRQKQLLVEHALFLQIFKLKVFLAKKGSDISKTIPSEWDQFIAN